MWAAVKRISRENHSYSHGHFCKIHSMLLVEGKSLERRGAECWRILSHGQSARDNDSTSLSLSDSDPVYM